MGQSIRQSRRPRIVIVGAGFGGLQAAQSLAGADAEILLIDRNNYHTFVPLLYQVASGQLDETSVTYPVRTLLRHRRNIQFLQATVKRVDFQSQIVVTDRSTISFDYLVLATGNQPRWYGVPGVEAHAFPLKTLAHAIALRNHILQCFEQALYTSNPDVCQRLLRFVVVGGGATGVEVAGSLAELIRWSMQRDFSHLMQQLAFAKVKPQVVLLHAGDCLMPEFPEGLGHYTARHLTRLGVQVWLQARVTAVTETSVCLHSGDIVESATVVWATGLEAELPELTEPLSTNLYGKLVVRSTMQVENQATVYAIGDVAYFEQFHKPLAGVAPEALQQGVAVAKNIRRQLSGRSPLPFRYFNKGRLAIIGGFGGIGQIAGIPLSGFLAWLMWLAVHLVYLPGYRNRMLVLMTWLHGYLLRDRPIRQLVIHPTAPRVPTSTKS